MMLFQLIEIKDHIIEQTTYTFYKFLEERLGETVFTHFSLDGDNVKTVSLISDKQICHYISYNVEASKERVEMVTLPEAAVRRFVEMMDKGCMA